VKFPIVDARRAGQPSIVQHRSIIATLLSLASCTERNTNSVADATVVISPAFEPGLAGKALIRGRRSAALPTNSPGNETLAEALFNCGQKRFELLGGETHWEAVAFPEGPEYRKVLTCVADHVSFGFVASHTSDPVITSTSHFRPILGI
jgi:hypothetical protein